MLRLISILVIITTSFITIKSTQGCTAFYLKNNSNHYVSKNFDWSIEDGYIFLNERNVNKSILVTEPISVNEFKWTSKYRSLTFNQFGKEFPLGGINERGLVVEELNAVPVKLKMNDSIRYLNEFQLTQFLLDNCSSVEEVVDELAFFQYKPVIQYLHYLIVDVMGNVLIIEYNGKNFDFHFANETGIPVLSNNNYEESLRYLSRFKGFGGNLNVINRQGSNERFVSAANGLKQYNNENPVQYSFELLNHVKQADTKWSIVYDVNNLSIHFKFHKCKKVTVYNFKPMLSLNNLNSSGCNLKKCTNKFSTITKNMNTTLLNNVFSALSNETGKEIDFNLLYKMAMVGNQYLEDSSNFIVIDELNELVKNFPDTTPLNFTEEFFHNLISWQNYDVIALGEGTHGTKEFCELKQRIFKYLVENHDFKILGYEYNFRKSIAINDYVINGTGNIDSIFQNESWIQNNSEVKQLIRWMNEYNKNRSLENKIRFIGIDNQLDAQTPIYLINYIKRFFPELALKSSLLLNQIEKLERISYHEMNNEEYLNRKNVFNQLLKQYEFYFNESYNIEPYQKLNVIQLIKSIINSHEFLYRLEKGENLRDKQLAENVINIFSNLPEKKLVLWAHNAHVAKNPDYYGHQQPAMGWYLNKELKNKYLSIATSFSKGQFKAVMLDKEGNDTQPLTCVINTEPPSVSTNSIFVKMNRDFALNVSSIDTSTQLYKYFDKIRPMIGIGDLYLGQPEKHFTNDRIINLIKAYDLIFYWNSTQPITFTP